jgi:hypothetical protein
MAFWYKSAVRLHGHGTHDSEPSFEHSQHTRGACTQCGSGWLQLSAGLHLGYSKKGKAGTWLVKLRDATTGKRYQQRLGPADHVLDAGAEALE